MTESYRPEQKNGRLTVLIMLSLAAATCLAYWGVWNYDFVKLDDTQYVVENRHVRGGLSWEGVKWAFTSFDASNWHPLTWLSHMLDVQVFGMWAGGHHLVNLTLHVMNTLLLLGFLRYTTGRLWPSVFVAALFALHPLHVESVAWISERKDVLSTFFWMATMWMYAFYARKPGIPRYLGVMAIFAAGLMSKPMLVTLPLVLLLLDHWPLERLESVRRLVLEKIPLMAMAACSAAVTMIAQREAINKLDVVDMAPRLTNAVISYGQYILKMFWPTDLSAFYPYSNEAHYLKAAIVILLLAAVTAFVLYRGKSFRYLPVGWLWYIVTLVPVIGIVRVGSQSHADRYTYVPLTGLFVMVAWGAAHILAMRPQLKGLFVLPAAVILASAGVMTNQTCGHWKDTYALSRHGATITKSPRMILLLASSQMDRGELDAALANLREAERLEPGDAEVLGGLGQVMLRMGKFADAVKYCQSAIEAEPNRRELWLNAGLALYGMGQVKEAENYLKKAIELDPYWAASRSQLGRLLGETGRIDESIAIYKKAIELDPLLPECHYNLGILYMRRNEFENAAAELKKKIAIEPDAQTWNSLGGCMVAMKKLDEAQRSYRESIKLEGDHAGAHYNLGIVLADMGRRDEAVLEVEKAVLLEPGNEEAKALLARLRGSKP